MLTGCGTTCLAADATWGELAVVGSVISALSDDALANDMSHMTNALEEKLIEQMDKGVDTLTNKFVRDINKDQASKQSATVSTVDDFDRHMWDSVHEDALTGDALPTQIEITGLNSYFLSTVLCGYVQNVWQSALISDVLHAAVVFVSRTPRISVLSEKVRTLTLSMVGVLVWRKRL